MLRILLALALLLPALSSAAQPAPAGIDADTDVGSPRQYDTFIVRWCDRELRADAFITFALNPDGSIDQAKMQAVSLATDFSFDFQDLLLKPAKR